MEEKECCSHYHQGPVCQKWTQAAHPFPVIPVPCGTTCNRMVYMGRIYAPEAVQAQKTHKGHDEEDSRDPKGIANKATQCCRAHVAGMAPGLVYAKTRSEPSLSCHAQSDARKQRGDRRCSCTLQYLGEGRYACAVPQEENAAAKHNKHNAAGKNTPFVVRMIRQRSKRRGTDKAGKPAAGHHKAYCVRCPALSLQINTQKGTEAITHIGKSKAQKRKKGEGSLFRGIHCPEKAHVRVKYAASRVLLGAATISHHPKVRHSGKQQEVPKNPCQNDAKYNCGRRTQQDPAATKTLLCRS